MLTITVKFNSGLYKAFENVEPENANYRDNVLTIVKGNSVVRIPLTSIMYFETFLPEEGVAVEGEGRVKE